MQSLMQSLTSTSFNRGWYHGGCPDGIGAMWCFWSKNRDRELKIEGLSSHTVCPEFNDGDTIVVVDFSFKEHIIREVCKRAKYLLILDHHKTAITELQSLGDELDNFGYVFDIQRSGAQIAWDWCNPDTKRPWFIEMIADRDLWKWKIPGCKIVTKAMYEEEWYTFERLEEIYQSVKTDDEWINTFCIKGQIMDDIEQKKIAKCVEWSSKAKWVIGDNTYIVRINTYNIDGGLRSELGNAMSEIGDCDFAVVWRYSPLNDQWYISLRGAEGCKIQLNELCEKYNGGGHSKACGFAIHGPRSPELKNENKKIARGSLLDYFELITE